MDRLSLGDVDFNPFSALPFEFSYRLVNELGNFRRPSFTRRTFGIASDSLDNGAPKSASVRISATAVLSLSSVNVPESLAR